MAPTWLITGSSSGFGLTLARYILSQGHNVIATSRNPAKTPDLVKEITSNPAGRWLALDVTWPKPEIDKVIQQAWTEFDGIDILVNNAGYSLLGAAEDLPEDRAKAEFEVNFWGLIRTTQAALPLMRSRKSGTIVNISSIAGLDALPTCAIYAGSKFALEAWSESLSKEVAPLGLRVLIVEPGAFRTNFLTKEATQVVQPSEAYQDGPVQAVLEKLKDMNGMQKGDPVKAAQRIFEAVLGVGMGEDVAKRNFLRLPLGPDCYSRALESTRIRKENLDAVKSIALSTDFE
jgi:short-subunit dehydrogenase